MHGKDPTLGWTKRVVQEALKSYVRLRPQRTRNDEERRNLMAEHMLLNDERAYCQETLPFRRGVAVSTDVMRITIQLSPSDVIR